MCNIPNDSIEIKKMILQCEYDLKREKIEYGFYLDKSGSRYLIAPLYLLLDDTENAYKSFKWFESTFQDDVGEPFHYLCWTLTLLRKEKFEAARRKLIQTMFSNLYIIPYLLGKKLRKHNIWHGSSWAEKEYIDEVPNKFLRLWNSEELIWAEKVYNESKIKQVRKKYISILRKLKDEKPGPRRNQLVNEEIMLQNQALE